MAHLQFLRKKFNHILVLSLENFFHFLDLEAVLVKCEEKMHLVCIWVALCVSSNGCTDDWQQELRLSWLSIGHILKSQNVLCYSQVCKTFTDCLLII